MAGSARTGHGEVDLAVLLVLKLTCTLGRRHASGHAANEPVLALPSSLERLSQHEAPGMRHKERSVRGRQGRWSGVGVQSGRTCTR